MKTTTMSSSLLLLLLLLSLVLSCHASFVVQIPEDDEQCFVIRAPPNSIVSGNWDVLDDNLSPDPVRFKLLNGDNMQSLYESQRGSSEDTFRVPTKEGGRFYACVSNGVDHESEDELDRSIGLDVRVSLLPQGAQENQGAQELITAAEDITEKMMDLQTHFDYLRNREAAHRATTEDTFTYVVRWSILEFVVLLGIAIAQVLALRMFFERKRYI